MQVSWGHLPRPSLGSYSHSTNPSLILLPMSPFLGHFAHGSDRHMVSLEDLFQRFPQVPMSVEIKEKDEKLIYKVKMQSGQGHSPGPRETWLSLILPLLLLDSRSGEAL